MVFGRFWALRNGLVQSLRYTWNNPTGSVAKWKLTELPERWIALYEQRQEVWEFTLTASI